LPRSLFAWSTPFLNTDQNEPVSPWVTTATFVLVAATEPSAAPAAGPPRIAAPAVRRPPRTTRSRRLRPVSSMVSCSLIELSFLSV
jgi:hypothetical protein